jgi:hypothetical protein
MDEAFKIDYTHNCKYCWMGTPRTLITFKFILIYTLYETLIHENRIF